MVVEGDVSYKLMLPPPVQNQAPSYDPQYGQQGYEPNAYDQHNYGQDYSQDQYFQGGK